MTDVQGTVSHWSSEDGTRVLLDDGSALAVPAPGLVGARLLRAGQRVHVRLDGDGRPVAVTLLTLPLDGPPADGEVR